MSRVGLETQHRYGEGDVSHAFVLPALTQTSGITLESRAEAWANNIRSTEAELASLQLEIDNLCFDLYGIDEADRRIVTQGFGESSATTDAEVDTVFHADVDTEVDTDADPEEDTKYAL